MHITKTRVAPLLLPHQPPHIFPLAIHDIWTTKQLSISITFTRYIVLYYHHLGPPSEHQQDFSPLQKSCHVAKNGHCQLTPHHQSPHSHQISPLHGAPPAYSKRRSIPPLIHHQARGEISHHQWLLPILHLFLQPAHLLKHPRHQPLSIHRTPTKFLPPPLPLVPLKRHPQIAASCPLLTEFQM